MNLIMSAWFALRSCKADITVLTRLTPSQVSIVHCCLMIFVSVCLSVCLSICLSVCLSVCRGHGHTVWSLATHADRLYSSCSGGEIKMWNISDSIRGCIKSIRMHSTYVCMCVLVCGCGCGVVCGVRWGMGGDPCALLPTACRRACPVSPCLSCLSLPVLVGTGDVSGGGQWATVQC